MMPETLVIRDEVVTLDLDRLGALRPAPGDAEAEARLAAALEALAATLADVEACWRRGDSAQMMRALGAAQGLAEPLGMVKLEGTLRAVRACLAGGDAVALAATLARMLRVGERSLVAIWDRHGMLLL